MSFNDDDAVFVTADKISEKDEKVETYDVEIVSDEELIEKTDDDVTETAIQPVNNNNGGALADYEILNPEISMRQKVSIATGVADCLKDVIETQGLVKYGLNKKDPKAPYVLTEGWEVLGTFLGIVPVTKVIAEIHDKQGRIKGYKARATLYRNPIMENDEIVGGTVLSQTEASATKEGFQKDTSSMMSMAQTRALGKAYRMTLGWIMKMAGYEGTPAEEMSAFKGD